VDLHRLAVPWSHYPIRDLRVHPGELQSRFALREEPVGRIDVDAKSRSLLVMFDDVPQGWQDGYRESLVPLAFESLVDRVDEPKTCIDCIVVSATGFRKPVRD